MGSMYSVSSLSQLVYFNAHYISKRKILSNLLFICVSIIISSWLLRIQNLSKLFNNSIIYSEVCEI